MGCCLTVQCLEDLKKRLEKDYYLFPQLLLIPTYSYLSQGISKYSHRFLPAIESPYSFIPVSCLGDVLTIDLESEKLYFFLLLFLFIFLFNDSTYWWGRFNNLFVKCINAFPFIAGKIYRTAHFQFHSGWQEHWHNTLTGKASFKTISS